MSLISVLVGLLFAMSAFAVDFPAAGGDIASSSAWGGDLPRSTDPVTFKESGVYTASADVTFGKMTVTAPEATFDFSEAPGRVVRISATSTAAASALTLARDVKLTFRKGTWYSSSASGEGNAALGNGTSRGLLVVDDACVTNFGYFYVASGSGSANRLALTNNAVLQCGQFVISRTQSGSGNAVELSAGSRLAATEFLTEWYGTKSETSGFNSFLATGIGTTVDVSRFVIGNRHGGNQIRFTDGAKLTTGMLQYGLSSTDGVTPGADGNVILVDNGASVVVTNVCNIGYKTVNSALIVSNAASLAILSDVNIGSLAGAINHTLFVGKKATFTASRDVFVGGAASDNALLVSNAAACRVTRDLVVGRDVGADRNLFAVYGNYTAGDIDFASVNFGSGSFNRIVLSGGMTLSHDTVSPYWSEGSSNNILRLENNASYTLKNVWLGGKSAGCNNRVEIGAGARLTAYRLHTTGVGNALVISNGTYVGTSDTTTGIGDLGSVSRDHVAPANNFLRLEGNCPAIRFTAGGNSGLRVSSNSWIEVSVPAGGYLENHVPITGGTFSIDATCDINFELDAYLTALGDESGLVTIVDVVKGITVPDEVLARANARLPERCKLVLEDGRKLVLKTKSNKGLILLLR